MTIRYSTGTINRLLGDYSVSNANNGLAGVFKDGFIYIYSGSQPASADSAATGTLLAKVSKDAGSFTHGVSTNGLQFGVPSGGVISKSGSQNWQYTGIASGTAGWFRFVGNAADVDSSSIRMDGSISTTSGDLILSTTTIVIGTPGTIDQFTITAS